MRNLARELFDHFGSQYNAQINTYLSEQWMRQSTYKNCSFTLADVDEADLTRSILKFVKRLSLSAEEFLSHTMIRAYVNVSGDISSIISFKSSFYQKLMTVVASTESMLFHDGDEIEFRGKDKPIKFKRKSKKRSDVFVGGFINGISSEDETFSLILSSEQWFETVKLYGDVKLNGTVFADKEWEKEVSQSFLYHRLIDEFIGTILNDSSPETYEKYRAAVDFELEYFKASTSLEKVVFSKRGYRLGKTVKLFDGADVLAAKKETRSLPNNKAGIKIVVNNTQTKTLNPASDGQQDVFCEWGDF